jgi:hypothetical protein
LPKGLGERAALFARFGQAHVESRQTGEVLGEDGAATDDVRLINESDFRDVSSRHGGTITGATATSELQAASQVVTVNEAQVNGAVQGVADATRSSGVEHSTVFTLDLGSATVTAMPGPTGNSTGTVLETVPNGAGLPLYVPPGGGPSVSASGGILLVVGQAHGHPPAGPGYRNVQGVSADDRATAQSVEVPVYALDSWTGRAGGAVRIHRANTDGTQSLRVGMTAGGRGTSFNIGLDALNRSVNLRK